MSPKFLPFADAASPDLPLSRLLRLSLFQISVGMALAMLIGTLVDELERQNKTTGLITMCTGGGMGTATIIERI